MKKLLTLIFLFILCTVKANALEFNVSSQNIILYNLDNGEILYEKSADEKVPIASLTKIMTALVTLENVDNLDDRVILT